MVSALRSHLLCLLQANLFPAWRPAVLAEKVAVIARMVFSFFFILQMYGFLWGGMDT